MDIDWKTHEHQESASFRWSVPSLAEPEGAHLGFKIERDKDTHDFYWSVFLNGSPRDYDAHKGGHADTVAEARRAAEEVAERMGRVKDILEGAPPTAPKGGLPDGQCDREFQDLRANVRRQARIDELEAQLKVALGRLRSPKLPNGECHKHCEHMRIVREERDDQTEAVTAIGDEMGLIYDAQRAAERRENEIAGFLHAAQGYLKAFVPEEKMEQVRMLLDEIEIAQNTHEKERIDLAAKEAKFYATRKARDDAEAAKQAELLREESGETAERDSLRYDFTKVRADLREIAKLIGQAFVETDKAEAAPLVNLPEGGPWTCAACGTEYCQGAAVYATASWYFCPKCTRMEKWPEDLPTSQAGKWWPADRPGKWMPVDRHGVLIPETLRPAHARPPASKETQRENCNDD